MAPRVATVRVGGLRDSGAAAARLAVLVMGGVPPPLQCGMHAHHMGGGSRFFLAFVYSKGSVFCASIQAARRAVPVPRMALPVAAALPLQTEHHTSIGHVRLYGVWAPIAPTDRFVHAKGVG